MNLQSYRASVAFLYANGKRRHLERLCLRLAKAVTEDLVYPHRALALSYVRWQKVANYE